MPNLNINTLELVSSVRTSGLNAPPSSADYNETQREVLVDLSALAGIINDLLIPYFNALNITSASPVNDPLGIEGSTVFSDTSDQSDIFFNAITSTPLCLSDSLRLLRAMITLLQNTVGDLNVEIQAVQSRVSGSGSSNLANVVQQLRNFYDALNTIVGEHTIELQKLDNFQQVRTVTPSIAPGASALVPVTWPVAYSDDNYTVSLAFESGSGTLHLDSFVKISTGVGLQVLITNNSTTLTQSGTIHASGQHD